MPAATKAGAGNLDHFSSLQVVGLSEIKPRRLKDYTDVISGFLAEFDRYLKSSIILNHSLHSLAFRLMLSQKAFPKNSRWRYWI